jgi:PHD/YefM family antitoxin component YafN of YafNO toxin-antitoxin module
MKTVPANDLKTKGIKSIGKALEKGGEVVITVRGQERYVVMDIDTYNHLRACELEAALYESRREVADGRYVEETVEEHIRRIAKAAE